MREARKDPETAKNVGATGEECLYLCVALVLYVFKASCKAFLNVRIHSLVLPHCKKRFAWDGPPLSHFGPSHNHLPQKYGPHSIYSGVVLHKADPSDGLRGVVAWRALMNWPQRVVGGLVGHPHGCCPIAVPFPWDDHEVIVPCGFEEGPSRANCTHNTATRCLRGIQWRSAMGWSGHAKA